MWRVVSAAAQAMPESCIVASEYNIGAQMASTSSAVAIENTLCVMIEASGQPTSH